MLSLYFTDIKSVVIILANRPAEYKPYRYLPGPGVPLGSQPVRTTTEATGAKWPLISVFGTADGKKLWAVGNRGAILHSADGERWTVQDSNTTADLTSIFGTPDGKNLWAVGMEDRVAKSRNGFVSMDYPELIRNYPPPYLNRATILHTIDGEHWTIEDSNTDKNLFSIFGTPDGKHLWAVGGQLTDPGFPVKNAGMIVHSTDGEHWSVQEPTEHCLNYVFGTPDGKNSWAVGNDGSILHSTDGEHWATQSSHSGGDLFFVLGTPDGKRLWAFGESKHEGTVRTGVVLDGFDIGRARYIEMARLRTTLTGARLELKLEGPIPLSLSAVLSLSARNDFDFENRRPPADLRAVYHAPAKGDPPGVYAFDFDPSKAAIERGKRVHFEITLDDQLIKQQFDYAATYDPFGYFRENAKWLIPLVAVVFVVACLTLFLFTKPLWNLYLYRQFKLYKVNEISIPGIGDPLKIVLKSVSVLPWFVTHHRTLDAWIKQNRDRLEASWNNDVAQASLTEGRYPELSGAYIQLPVRIGDPTAGVVIQQPTSEDFNQIFSGSRRHVQIVGPGGAGKTTLARQIGRWALDGSLKGGRDRHAMLPIWIDEDVDSNNTVSKVVRDKLFATLSDEDIEVNFCDAMARNQRLLVIIDRLSERSAETQDYIRNIYRSTRLGALIITSRSKVPVGGISPILLFPQPLSSASLLFFMTGLLSILAVKGTETNLDLSPLRTISEQLDLGQRLSGLIQVRTGDGNQEIPILPLPVRVFIEQAVELLSNGGSLDDLPSSLPEVYVQYLRRINPKTASANLLSDDDMLKAGIALGKIALRPNFIPKEFAPEAAREALKKIGWVCFDDVDPIERLKANGVIVQKQIGAYSRLRFVLDPIAEFLAAFAYAEECGANEEAWKQILDETSVAALGFHIALQLIRQAYGSRLGWAGDEALERS